jgi:hypothetical protein
VACGRVQPLLLMVIRREVRRPVNRKPAFRGGLPERGWLRTIPAGRAAGHVAVLDQTWSDVAAEVGMTREAHWLLRSRTARNELCGSSFTRRCIASRRPVSTPSWLLLRRMPFGAPRARSTTRRQPVQRVNQHSTGRFGVDLQRDSGGIGGLAFHLAETQ